MSWHRIRPWRSMLIALVLAALSSIAGNAADELRKLSVVSFGLFGDQRVFQSEATGAAQIVAKRFGADPVIVKFNTKKGGDATTASLAASLQATAKNMADASDVLFLILTSHGSQDGLAVFAGRRREILTPARLAGMLDQTGVRYRIVVISACYSGVFIPRLANPDSLVITAADADHSSFGCEDRAKWTYFGDAFFNIALRRTTRLKDAFVLARELVAQREARNGFERAAAGRPPVAWATARLQPRCVGKIEQAVATRRRQATRLCPPYFRSSLSTVIGRSRTRVPVA